MTICEFISTGMGSGKAKIAPGTAGSIVAYFIWLGFAPLCSNFVLFAVALSTTIIGLYATDRYLQEGYSDLREQKHIDPKEVVIDEWAGLYLGLACLPTTTLPHSLLGLCLFRVFDILKPGPVRWAEKLPRHWGIMIDDLVAGLLAAGSVQLLDVLF